MTRSKPHTESLFSSTSLSSASYSVARHCAYTFNVFSCCSLIVLEWHYVRGKHSAAFLLASPRRTREPALSTVGTSRALNSCIWLHLICFHLVWYGLLECIHPTSIAAYRWAPLHSGTEQYIMLNITRVPHLNWSLCRYHPDKNPGDAKAELMFQRVCCRAPSSDCGQNLN